MPNPLRLFPALLLTLLTLSINAVTQTQGAAVHLTVYDAGLAEVLEERTVELQPGLNQAEWRSLMPKAYARTEGVTQVVGQDRIPLTPPGGEFSVTQGRSSTLFGTRRVLERRQIEYRSQEGNTR